MSCANLCKTDGGLLPHLSYAVCLDEAACAHLATLLCVFVCVRPPATLSFTSGFSSIKVLIVQVVTYSSTAVWALEVLLDCGHQHGPWSYETCHWTLVSFAGLHSAGLTVDVQIHAKLIMAVNRLPPQMGNPFLCRLGLVAMLLYL